MKYGRRPPSNAPALKLAPLLTGVVPTHPPAANTFTALQGGWQMLGNDQYGVCVGVTWANYRRVMTHQAGRETYPGFDDVVAVYKTQNPGFPTEDNGMVIQDCLDYLTKVGGPDGVKAVAFARVDHKNPDEIKAAIAIFGAVWVGVYVQQANMQQFHADQPWNYVPNSPIDGGHSIIVGGYDSDGVGGDERCITWGKETSFTDEFWTHNAEEAWVVIWPEHLTSPAFLEGIDTAALAAAYQEITGRPLPIPTPQPPAPTPEPTPEPPTPATPDDTLAAAAKRYVAQRHHGENRIMQRALRSWLVARGYVTGEEATQFSVLNATEAAEDSALGFS